MEITREQLEKIEDAIDTLTDQRSTYDQEQGTDNDIIDAARTAIKEIKGF